MIPINPMLAVQGKAFSSKDWIFEPKIDGARCIAFISGYTVELQNRRLKAITYRYPEVVRSLKQAVSGDCILDGEMSVFSKGVPSFSSLAVREQQPANKNLRIDYLSKALPASYIVFDILYKDGESLMDHPLEERKSILKAMLKEDSIVTIIDYLQEDGEAYFKAALKSGLEGIVAKRLASTYQPGVRSLDWIKIKRQLTFDLVVGGYSIGIGQREPFFGSLLLGAYDSSKLVFAGKVGSGFSMQELKEISGEFNPSDHSPFFNLSSMRDVRWLKPELVVEVEALEVSKRKHLRAPVFLRKRDDKSPQECTIDQLQIA